jgi:hypothetical protein
LALLPATRKIEEAVKPGIISQIADGNTNRLNHLGE